ncbi:hypothetical protein FACS1894152_5040 [Bacilli bacterium]|nr:hypothetical protein FACS1894152_5040 [Bacilli bacterium]
MELKCDSNRERIEIRHDNVDNDVDSSGVANQIGLVETKIDDMLKLLKSEVEKDRKTEPSTEIGSQIKTLMGDIALVKKNIESLLSNTGNSSNTPTDIGSQIQTLIGDTTLIKKNMESLLSSAGKNPPADVSPQIKTLIDNTALVKKNIESLLSSTNNNSSILKDSFSIIEKSLNELRENTPNIFDKLESIREELISNINAISTHDEEGEEEGEEEDGEEEENNEEGDSEENEEENDDNREEDETILYNFSKCL